ncbi:hypothetical protein FSP39_024825 [Pinctada imbricata]|uniref:CCAAT-binding factor domain-containing protein n=1 Tax=Pinctada imbricata TaxID=66713 RepID=A0AA88XPP6_PINIB|nr:hypothetical protein FSP39_024825 [Pinctada imbricata]
MKITSIIELKGIPENAIRIFVTRTRFVLEYSLLLNEEPTIQLACIKAFHKIFLHFISTEELLLTLPEGVADEDLTKEEKYKQWLNDKYSTVIDILIQFTSSDNKAVREHSLCTLMKFVQQEGQTPITKLRDRQVYFPAKLFEKILSALVSDTTDKQDLIGRFLEYADYDDIRYYVLKFLLSSLKSKQQATPSDVYLNNLFSLLEQISFPQIEQDTCTHFLSKCPEEGAAPKMTSTKEHKKMFSHVWLDFLRHKLPASLYKRVLVMLHEKVMPHLTSPLLLSDFLTQSYEIGGAISLLALNGLFILVHKYNLDYPDFYEKLYALFEPSVFHVKYRARFFFLADLFLTSSHLPAYLVAAFAKRLAHLSLTAPQFGLTVTVPFIYNLINRHPNCKVLLHRPNSTTEVAEDPYLPEEPDPAKCQALQSSLWELQTLQNHINPDVARMCQRIDHPLQKDEIPLQDLLETSYTELFEKETKKKVKHASVNFDLPRGLLNHKSDRFAMCWTLT